MPEKKKYFTFSEKDLKWIDPLLHEWSRKEGKPYSDLILRLLEDYRDGGRREADLRGTLDTAASQMRDVLSDYSARSKEALDDVVEKSMEGLLTVQDKLKTGGKKLVDQIHRVESNIRARLEEAGAEN